MISAVALRALLSAIKRLAEAQGVQCTTAFHVISHNFDGAAEFHLSVHTSLDADAAMSFWDGIGELPEHKAIDDDGFWVSVEWDKEPERQDAHQ